ncbi:MAG: catalase [Oscillospiraceae bacterium]|nr:catalase [Oscillospiraceae bacterium]
MHPIAHFKTITEHRHLVCRYCMRLGLIWQGLTHDLSKYSPTEFWRGAKYYQGYRSPNDAERVDTGISLAWLHHKGRNRHHFEYWIDYMLLPDGSVTYGGNPMPLRYVAEMFCDRIAASRVYLGDAYTDGSAWAYYAQSKDLILMHPDTKAELEKMLLTLRDEGEKAAFAYVRRRLKEAR